MEIVKVSVPINSFVYVEETRINLPYKEFVPSLDSVDVRKVSPSRRSEGKLLSGNYTQIDREGFKYRLPESITEKGVDTIDDCKLIEFKEVNIERKELEPVTNSGYYVQGEEKRYLYPASSTVSTTEELLTIPNASEKYPVSIGIYKRNKYKEPVLHREVIQQYSTDWIGNLEAEGRSEDSDKVFQFSIDLEDYSFSYNTVVEENIPLLESILEDETPYEVWSEYLDFLGISDGQGCQGFYSKYFPISKRETGRTLKMYIVPPSIESGDPLSDAEVWESCEDLRVLDGDSKRFYCDYDLGFIHIGGLLGKDDFVLSDWDPESEEGSKLLPVLNPENHPSSGVVDVETMRVFFKGKIGHNLIIESIEGTLKEIEQGTPVLYRKTGAVPPEGSLLYIAYVAIGRIEYVDKNHEDLVIRPGENKSKIYLKNTESILVIDKENEQRVNVSLEALNLNLISLSGIAYSGPLSYEESVVLLRGRVTTEHGTPLIESEVEVTVLNGAGSFFGSNTITVFTDDEGYFYTSLYIDSSRLYEASYARNITYEEDEGEWYSFLDFNYPESSSGVPSSLEELHVYTVSKDDSFNGTVGKYHFFPIEEFSDYPLIGNLVGKDVYPYTSVRVKEVLGESYLSESGLDAGALLLIDESGKLDVNQYENGKIYLAVSNGPYVDGVEDTTIIEREVLKVIHYPEIWNSELTPISNNTRLSTLLVILNEKVDVSGGRYIRDCWMLSPKEKAWDPINPNGRKSVLRVIEGKDPDSGEDYLVDVSSSNWINPESESLPTFAPVTPMEWIGGNKFKFKGKLPACEVSNRRNNLGAYAIYLDKVCEVQARVKDKYCVSKYYTSNIVRIIFSASGKGKGTYRVDELNLIPFGFRLPDAYEYSSLLDGPVYLTINSSRMRSNSGLSFEEIINVPKVSFVNSESVVNYREAEVNPYNNYIGYHLTITN